MAKVTGPLFSMTAAGKVGDAMVHFSWKGISVVRQWLIPKNPKSADQGDQRLVLGGVGRACGVVQPLSDYHNQLISLGLILGYQTKQSYLVKRIIEVIASDATAFEAEYTVYAAHTGKSAFDAAAVNLGLADFDVSYKGTTHSFPGGLMVYMLAHIAIFNGFTGAPYSTALASWTSTQTDLLEADLALPA